MIRAFVNTDYDALSHWLHKRIQSRLHEKLKSDRYEFQFKGLGYTYHQAHLEIEDFKASIVLKIKTHIYAEPNPEEGEGVFTVRGGTVRGHKVANLVKLKEGRCEIELQRNGLVGFLLWGLFDEIMRAYPETEIEDESDSPSELKLDVEPLANLENNDLSFVKNKTHRKILKQWRDGKTETEISKSVDRNSQTVRNVVSQLRKKYGVELVPLHRKK